MAASPAGIRLSIWMAVFTLLTSAVIALRIWAIHITRKSLQLHDYFVIIAHISACTMTGLNYWAVANGLGGHTMTLSREELRVQFKMIIGVSMTWLTGTVCCKLSILSLYTSLFRTFRPIRMLVWVVSGLVLGYFVTFLPLFLTQCHPISYQWHPVPGGGCRSLSIQEIASITLNIFLDSTIALLPIPALWKLHMSLRNKLTIGLMFGMGLIVVAVMVWRLIITLDPSTAEDFVYGLSRIGLVSFLELWLSIIIVSLPVLAPLLRHYVEPLISHKRPSAGQLREAQHTIGSDPPNKRLGPGYGYTDVELGHSSYSAQGKTGVSSFQSEGEDTVGLVNNMQPNAITKKQEVVVQKRQSMTSPS
ncbi:hypothetical protein N7462_010869 [Penicillium macrosclerotiorum]|uniref:uncharacterized protein n=1 Tax=Penicillium macrosclerotiorum TaxID=303699 RepID=UPI00254731D9|nr:uncharacterized protein N7462_010869 [Penicillium macrosclerotiorum]KAJ5669799.1 hypothetical protein N7462_010869 [Penicillium macrosclerotiorum]